MPGIQLGGGRGGSPGSSLHPCTRVGLLVMCTKNSLPTGFCFICSHLSVVSAPSNWSVDAQRVY